MVTKWVTPEPKRTFRDAFAWRPTLALDTYTQRKAWVWLELIRIHDDGVITFSSFRM